MAQVLTDYDFTDRSIGMNSVAKRVYYLYEPVASVIGVGANRPYVACYPVWRATGASASFGTSGKLEHVALFTDGSEEVIATSDAPLQDVTIPTNTDLTTVVKANGQLQNSRVPAASTVVSSSSDAEVRERLPLNPLKTLDRMRAYWTPD